MRVAIACDHIGLEMKLKVKAHLEARGHIVTDVGAHSPDRVDYPLFGARAARLVAEGEVARAIVICGSGVGMSLAANKVPGVRCVLCSEPYSAVMSRNHNDTNALALGARVIGLDMAIMIVEMWMDATFEGGRHAERVAQLAELDATREAGRLRP